jgi:hypothetical protein
MGVSSGSSELIWILVIGSAIWVGFDSQRLGARAGVLGGGMADMGPAGWFLVVLLLWIVGFPAYLATRPRYVALRTSDIAPPPPASVTPPGWYSDPMKRHELRYWDGRTWTAHVSNGGAQSTDPLQ